MKLKGRTILVLCLLILGGYAYWDYLRDKKNEDKNMEQARLMTVNFEHVDSFEILKGEQKIVLKRSVDGWELIEPLKDLADNAVADDFVKNVFPERVIEVAREGGDIDWAMYGLDKPLAQITFKTTDGKENVFQISNKRNFEENVFARRGNENRVLIVNSVWQNRANKTASDFRDRRFLRHKIASVDVLKLKNSKGTMELKRVDGVWQLVGAKKDYKLDQNKVREVLTAISEAKAAEILGGKEKIPAGKSLFTMDLQIADKAWKAEVTQAPDLLIYAKVSDPAFQMKMEAGALDRFIKMSPDDLKETPPSKPETKEGEDQQQAMAGQKEKK
ncbi:hypothetical protein AZI85_03385 [Bdellovibrio bacteriovorus]|uniref:DUF4340 domain-containing protein n=1 Tax=Bdellovibrio bacteriovorus TaxID=959 RepID=A0A150WKQ6_BDEBC|nr:DUF4340 domain-containing protein [Bdellovibrio bacteriovorus]KYG64472.1 hypothetical protein AZI85_03385 [Bdellovibrio bacteriovorus]